MTSVTSRISMTSSSYHNRVAFHYNTHRPDEPAQGVLFDEQTQLESNPDTACHVRNDHPSRADSRLQRADTLSLHLGHSHRSLSRSNDRNPSSNRRCARHQARRRSPRTSTRQSRQLRSQLVPHRPARTLIIPTCINATRSGPRAARQCCVCPGCPRSKRHVYLIVTKIKPTFQHARSTM